ncbi:VWA domain-containing protein [Bacteroidia bacterium]|nr:VWA domain-containing protein [Bacteroidia bacterium]MDB9881539.1 VWA domain-containing protein [Bacteroidia bacterium]MDC1395293.1 VWA domain-containing protein [Bacteroidia bacterium]
MKKVILTTLALLLIVAVALSFSLPTLLRIKAYSAPMALPEIEQRDNTNAANEIQIALILDTSGSMDGLIDQAKSQLWGIINELSKAYKDSARANVRIALYEYGNDNISVQKDYVRQVLPFTTDLDDISEKLFALSTNGGSEYCAEAIHSSLNELTWSQESGMKVIYIAGNEPFNQGSFSHKEACEMASQNNVTVYPIFCGNKQEGLNTHWNDCAVITKGQYMNIDSDIKVVEMATPYDDSLDVLNYQLNNTYIYYGLQGRSLKEKQVKQDLNQETYSKANKVSRTMSKSSKMYSNEKWDLVDAYKKDKSVVNKVNKSTLPDSLKSLNDEELNDYVVSKNKEREKIKNEINRLGVNRTTYISKNKESSKDLTLGDRMVKTIKTEAKNKGYEFEK